MFVLLYASSAVKPFSEDDLVGLLRQSREKNLRLDITGMLLYKAGSFMQVLEGSKEAVLALMESIKADVRHHRIHILLQQEQPERDFRDWSMGFRRLDGDVPLEPGFSNFLDIPLNGQIFRDNPSRALQFLRCFRELGD